MAEALAPWLDFSPATFVGAAEAGQRLQQGEEQIGLERARLAQSASQAAAELGLRSQQLNEAQKEAATRHQLETEQLQNQFQRQQTGAAVTKAYHDAQIGLAQNRLDAEKNKLTQVATDKAMELADRQNYAMAIAGGMTPAEALAKYPRALASASALNRTGAGGTQTVVEHFPAKSPTADISDPGQPAKSGLPIWPALGVAGIIAKLRGGGNIGAQDAIPPVNQPGTPGNPAYTVSRKIPADVPAQYALNPPGAVPSVTNALPSLAAAPTNNPPVDGRAQAPKLKFIRDKDGNLVLADSQ